MASVFRIGLVGPLDTYFVVVWANNSTQASSMFPGCTISSIIQVPDNYGLE